MTIKRIRIQNFKCLEFLEFEPKAFTVIHGANGVGK